MLTTVNSWIHYQRLECILANNESMEMYLEVILILENEHGHAHNVDVASRLGVSKASVTKAMKGLKQKGYINKEAYGSITLTESGRKLSERIYQNHRMLSLFLENSLDLSYDEAAENACKIEHVLSDSMVQAIELYLERNNIAF